MVKDLFLTTRVLYVGILLVVLVPTVPLSITWFAVAVLFVFSFSFFWQYYVLDFMLRMMADKKQRSWLLAVWIVVSVVLMSVSLYFLDAFDWGKVSDEKDMVEELIRDFSGRLAFYFIFASMFVGGACSRRAWWEFL